MRRFPTDTRRELPVGSDRIDNLVLASGTAKTVTVPEGAGFAVFSATGTFYARFDGGAAAAPGADITNGTGSEVNPTARSVAGLPAFSVVAPAACVVAVAWYA